MAVAIGTNEWWEARKREQAKRRQEDRAEFFKSGDEIPDLDLMPPCPICDGNLDYDDGFYCEECEVQWATNGTEGHRICSCFTRNGVVDMHLCFHGEQTDDEGEV